MALLRTATYDEPKQISDALKFEMSQEYCREVITILSGQGVLNIGQVLGQITVGGASSAAKSGGNTGNGTFVLDVTTPVRPGAKVGVYALRVTVLHAANDYSVELQDPDGNSLGVQRLTGAGAAITIDDDIKGVLTDGGTDFVVGDGFDITIAAGSKKWKKSNLTAADGTQKAAGVLLQKVDATSGDAIGVAIVRGPAVLARNGLVWDASYDSEPKKDTSIADLQLAGIVTRASA